MLVARCRRLSELLLLAAALSSCSDASSAVVGTAGDTTPTYGGTLRLMGTSDVDHLSTTSTYVTMGLGLLRTISRQLVTNPADADYTRQTSLVPDLATVVPARENGGISADGRTYTFHLRRGSRWDTSPPRQVTAADEVRGIQMLCNPVSPTGAPGYFTTTIDGMTDFCAQFARVPGTVPAIRAFVASHAPAGVSAPDDSTVVFHLVQPASDFLNLAALPFMSPVPLEALGYLPDGPEFRAHFVSDGPYRVAGYVQNRSIVLTRNPGWDPASDPVRRAYPDSIQIIEGVDPVSVQQEIEAGATDMEFGVYPSSVDLASLVPLRDPDLIIGPPGDVFAGGVYLSENFVGNTANGALRKLAVRQALTYAVNRAALVQVYGGPIIAQALTQTVPTGAGGYSAGYDPYPTPQNRGDPAKARALLASAGYPNGLTLKLLYMLDESSPRVAQSVQASVARAGIRLQLLPATISDFYAKYLGSPDNARRGVWDLAENIWLPDWYGAANGRSLIEPLFDGRQFGPNTNDYGDFNNPTVNAAIDAALSAQTPAATDQAWQRAAKGVMDQAGVIPLVQRKYGLYHSARLQGCIYQLMSTNCDLAVVWLRGAAGARRQLAATTAVVH